jgi:hypothetical protein
MMSPLWLWLAYCFDELQATFRSAAHSLGRRVSLGWRREEIAIHSLQRTTYSLQPIAYRLSSLRPLSVEVI